jgi:hypothetical protein
VGTAAPRTEPPSQRGGGSFGGFIPWGYGGLGLYGGYYGGYYDPWYDPWYDPYGGSYGYPYPVSSYGLVEEGALRLKVKPREAEVHVDGYYFGLVDDFDGVFQQMHLEAGPHRIDVRAPGYEPLTFDVRIEPGHKTTFQGELTRIQ